MILEFLGRPEVQAIMGAVWISALVAVVVLFPDGERG